MFAAENFVPVDVILITPAGITGRKRREGKRVGGEIYEKVDATRLLFKGLRGSPALCLSE